MPKCQFEELFVSLYRAGDTPTELVLYPGETHGFLGTGKPATRQDACERIIEWLEYYVREAPVKVKIDSSVAKADSEMV